MWRKRAASSPSLRRQSAFCESSRRLMPLWYICLLMLPTARQIFSNPWLYSTTGKSPLWKGRSTTVLRNGMPCCTEITLAEMVRYIYELSTYLFFPHSVGSGIAGGSFAEDQAAFVMLIQVEAMLDKTICALSNVFIGSSGSTFTEDIFRLRRGWGSASHCDEYLCQGELPNYIAEQDWESKHLRSISSCKFFLSVVSICCVNWRRVHLVVWFVVEQSPLYREVASIDLFCVILFLWLTLHG